ncbi:MAG: FkbM family methyltransferase [Roseburia sp.]
MKGKVLAIEVGGQYDVLPVFFDKICKGFEEAGYGVQRYEFNDSTTNLFSMPFEEFDFIFSINSAILEYLSTRISCTTIMVAFFVDHPIYHDTRIRMNNSLNYLGIHVDKYRMQFAEKYYPSINKNVMIAHGGSEGKNCKKEFESRKYDIVQIGGYQKPEEIMKQICEERGNNIEFSLSVINKFLTLETISIEEAIREVSSECGQSLTDEEVLLVVKEFALEDRFIRAYTRELAIQILLENGIKVDVFGNGWEKYEKGDSQLLHIHKPVGYKEALDIMGDSKIVLNVAPTLNYGSHERIFDAMQNGAICFTNRSLYLEEEGLDQEVIMYSIQEMNTLPEMIKLILDNPGKAEVIAKHAQKVALECHSWKNRAQEVIRAVESYQQEKNYINDFKITKDKKFDKLFLFLQNNSKEELVKKMKSCLLSHEQDESGYMQKALHSYNEYGYWGRCNPENNDFELLENRAKEIKEHLDDFIWLMGEVNDNLSKEIVYCILRYWLDYSPLHLKKIVSQVYDQYFDKDIISCKEDEVIVDCGAYIGDSVMNYLQNYGKYNKIYCYEASEKNLEVCKKNLKLYSNIIFRDCAVGNENKVAYLNKSNDESANVVSGTNGVAINMVKIDEDIKEPVTFIKMDIEGGEIEALLGAKNHISKEHPKLAIAAYHNNHDIWRLARLIKEIDSGYKLYIRYYGGTLYPSKYVLYGVWEDNQK